MRKSRFLNVIKNNCGTYFLHNTLRGSMLKAKCPASRLIVDKLVSTEMLDYDENNKFHKMLRNLHMVITDDVNEMSLLNYYYLESARDMLYLLPIVTRQCDFRCTYCYQKHENRTMSSETYENLLVAVKKEIDFKGYRTVNISFFGGEPLLEYDAICGFMEELQEMTKNKSILVHGYMTTNAYKLSFEKLTKLVKLGVTNYQITVDGLRETHNVSRVTVGGKGTWDTIIKNLHDAKNSNLVFHILLRTNFDVNLVKDFENYLRFMSASFSGDSRFVVGFKAVKDLGIKPDNEMVNLSKEVDVSKRMYHLAKELNLGLVEYPWDLLSGMCYASKTSSLVIDTDGTLLKCTTAIDSPENRVGKLTKNGFEIEDTRICKWTSYDLAKECLNCPILALCYCRSCPVATRESHITDPEYCKSQTAFYEDNMRIRHLGD